MSLKQGQNMISLDGEKIALRELDLKDVSEQYVKWLNDPEVNQYLELRFEMYTLEKVRAYVRSFQEKTNEILWGIFSRDDGGHIGNIKLGPIHPQHKFAHIGIMIGDKQYWGKGIATEAISLVVRYAFDELRLHKLLAGCYRPNAGSARAFEKCGFHIEGTEKSQWLYQGKYIDSYRMALINPVEGVSA